MKRFFATLLSVALIVLLIPVNALAASGSLLGPANARPGNTISVTFRVSGGSYSGYSGSLSYDTSVLTLTGASSSLGGSWAFSRNGNNIVAYDTTGTGKASGSLFTATFKVNNGVAPGTAMRVSFSGTVSAGSDESVSGTYSGVVAAPLSTDATLSRLVVANATLSPAFSPNVTNYSCGTVSFEVAKLSISATANADGAKVSVLGSNLSVGKNTVSVVVTAPSGTKKTYTITVERQQDPNYVPSSNTDLTGINISSGTISPEFAVNIRDYVAYVPFEVSRISLSGAAANPLAKSVTGIEDAELKEGENVFELKCIAEDGTEGKYVVHVVRMPKYAGASSIVLPDLGAKPEETTKPAETQTQDNSTTNGVPIILTVVLSLACLFLGVAITFVIFRRKADKEENELIEEIEVNDIDSDLR